MLVFVISSLIGSSEFMDFECASNSSDDNLYLLASVFMYCLMTPQKKLSLMRQK